MIKELALKKKEGAKDPFLKFILAEHSTLIMEWHGFVKGDLIKEGHEDVFKHIQEHNIKGIIEDVVDFSGPFSEVNDWFINYWVPKAIKLGLKKAAVLMNKNIFTELSVNSLKENPEFKKLGLGYRIFGDKELAKAWLLEEEPIHS